MYSPHRRGLLLGAAAGAAGLAILGRPSIGNAAVALQGPLKPNVYRFRLGSFEVTTILDGLAPNDGPHPTFGADQTPEAAAELATANFLPADTGVNSFTPVVVNTGTQVILFDTGNGPARRPAVGNLAASLTAAGILPESVDIVVLTHFHGDHIGGLMEGETAAFPNAAYVAGRTEYDFWTHPDRLSGPTENSAKLVQANVVPYAERMNFIEPGADIITGITAIEAFGHSPGHMAYNIESEGRRLVLTADTANHYVMSLQKPDWEVRFDMDKAKAAATRKSIFGMLAADKVPFVGYHMPFPAVGYVEPMGDGFRYVAAGYQFDL
ncbi:MBL fold metallo-hydrolase [Methylobrevis sp. L22]|uniref:MBL fold metallo-hydrolase n=1 Tax=Methylobrevis albus TaxID=2793297 RepID=A0A931I4T5_9HYPH|nr:MBL fold metallo-hydrolase [Methylobrevis albus]